MNTRTGVTAGAGCTREFLRDRRRLVLLAAAAIVVGASPGPAQQTAVTATSERLGTTHFELAEYLDELGRLDQFSGTVLVTDRDRVVLRGAVGQADRALGVETRPDQRFIIGSQTKAFTAVLVLQQVAHGRLKLDAPVVEYWPGFPDPSGGAITTRHLLTHQSGLPHWGAVEGFLTGDALLPQDHEQLLRRYAATGLRFAPGEDEAYSSLGYYALGLLLERLTGTTYAELLRREILEPLDMSHTQLVEGSEIVPGMARAYRYSFLEARYENAEVRDPSTTWSAGGLVSTVDDLLRWTWAIGDPRLLPEDLWTLALDVAAGRQAYGWSKRWDSRAGERVFWHAGLVAGYRSQTTRFPDSGRTVVLLGNLRDIDTFGITESILKVLDGDFIGRPKPSAMKEVLRVAAANGPEAARSRFDQITSSESDQFAGGTTDLLRAALELRSDDACERAAPLYEHWLAVAGRSPYRAGARVGAADCWLRLGKISRAAVHIESLGELEPEHPALAELRFRLESTRSRPDASAGCASAALAAVADSVAARFQDSRFVLLGSTHGGVKRHALLVCLVSRPSFRERVTDLVAEFASPAHQRLLDRYFVELDTIPVDSLRPAWLDTAYPQLWATLPQLPEFARAVRAVNESLNRSDRLRIIGGNEPVDWSRVEAPDDLAGFAYKTNWTAHVVLEHLARDPDARALVVYGDGHIQYGGTLTGDIEDGVEPHELFVIGTLVSPPSGRTELVGALGDPDAPYFADGSNFPTEGSLDQGLVDLLGFSTGASVGAGRTLLGGRIDALLYLGPTADEDLRGTLRFSDDELRELERRARLRDRVSIEDRFGGRVRWFEGHPEDLPPDPRVGLGESGAHRTRGILGLEP